MSLIKQKLIEYLINNPSLTEDADYLPDSKRYKIYTEQANQLTDREALEQIHASLEPSELMDFIEALASDCGRIGETINNLIDLQDDIREDMNDKSNRGDVSDYVKNKIREFINMELN